ncbi:MAG TPA: pyridoxal phosphate-dependent aminotransferase [Reyranella sp.]|nr:pyridoxal phosphate-dependent aminotransferase [Reyranella sp.]
MPIEPAARMAHIGAETAFEVLVRARALEAKGRSVVHLEIGEPDFDTPGHIIQAAQHALEAGFTHYGPGVGLPELREAVTRYLKRWRNIDVDPSRVVVTPGGKPVMFFAILALINPGDEVLYPDPGFPIYESMARFVGGKPVPMPLREERQFRFDPDEFRSLVSDRTRLIIINSPHNPTGSVLTHADLEVIADVARERDIVVLSDEIYARILYRGQHESIATLPGMLERTILLDGWSKTWAMTGWRLGFGVFPPEMMLHIDRLISNSVSCTASFSQQAAIAALEGPQDAVDAMLAEFSQRREVIVNGLNTLPGVTCLAPDGAFYAFPNITATGFKSKELADRLLDEAGVACLAGTAFGLHGEGYLRFSYANTLENIGIALERVRGLLTGARAQRSASVS